MDMKILPTVGSIEYLDDGGIIINRSYFRQGYVFKDWQAFRDGITSPCYVPELSDTVYSRNDFINLCCGDEDIAAQVFEAVDWQHPETYIDELFFNDELDICKGCGKLFWCYEVDKCPHCGKERKKE